MSSKSYFVCGQNLFTRERKIFSATELWKFTGGKQCVKFNPQSKTDFKPKNEYGRVEGDYMVRYHILMMADNVAEIKAAGKLRAPKRTSDSMAREPAAKFLLQHELKNTKAKKADLKAQSSAAGAHSASNIMDRVKKQASSKRTISKSGDETEQNLQTENTESQESSEISWSKELEAPKAELKAQSSTAAGTHSATNITERVDPKPQETLEVSVSKKLGESICESDSHLLNENRTLRNKITEITSKIENLQVLVTDLPAENENVTSANIDYLDQLKKENEKVLHLEKEIDFLKGIVDKIIGEKTYSEEILGIVKTIEHKLETNPGASVFASGACKLQKLQRAYSPDSDESLCGGEEDKVLCSDGQKVIKIPKNKLLKVRDADSIQSKINILAELFWPKNVHKYAFKPDTNLGQEGISNKVIESMRTILNSLNEPTAEDVDSDVKMRDVTLQEVREKLKRTTYNARAALSNKMSSKTDGKKKYVETGMKRKKVMNDDKKHKSKVDKKDDENCDETRATVDEETPVVEKDPPLLDPTLNDDILNNSILLSGSEEDNEDRNFQAPKISKINCNSLVDSQRDLFHTEAMLMNQVSADAEMDDDLTQFSQQQD